MTDEKPKPAYSYNKTRFNFKNFKIDFKQTKVKMVIALLAVGVYACIRVLPSELETFRLRRAAQEVSILENELIRKKDNTEENSYNL